MLNKKVFGQRLLIFLALAICCSCASGVCRLDLQYPNSLSVKNADISKIDSALWAQLLLRGNNYTCTGAQMGSKTHPAKHLGAYRSIVQPNAAGEGRHLVWLIVARVGLDFVGPLAVVERRGDALVARSVGMLSSPGGSVELRYNFGEHRETVWAISKICRNASALSRQVCHEQATIFAVDAGRLVPLSVPITLQQEQVVALGGGWHHVSQKRCEITEQADRFILAQTHSEHEIQAHRPNAQPRRRRSETSNFEICLAQP